ncbi:MAG: DedA family protein [Gammaproteobacteria bacterium]|nr:DedA family protein [Gammaproteobacteria bacterium]
MIEQLTKDLLKHIEAHPEWAFSVVFAIAFLESLAFIGVLMPGWLLLVGVGALVGVGVLSFYDMVAAMFIGAVLGEGLSYYLGFHYRDQIRHWKWLDSHQSALERADRFIRRYGVISLVVGRFIGPLRAILPVIAGISGMKQKIFWLVNILSGLLWAPLYLMPGILVGVAVILPEGSKEVMAIFILGQLIFSWLARRWWVLADKPDNESIKKQLKTRSMLALLCCALLIVILISSSIGQSILLTVLQVFSKVT